MAEPPDVAIRPGDQIRVALDFARWVARHPTAVLTVRTITRRRDGVLILGLQWPPSDRRREEGP